MSLLLKTGFILGSASPRRLELLKQAGLEPVKTISADIDETPLKGELPKPYVIRMAKEKAEKLIPLAEGKPLLAADTVVAVGRRILGKPRNKEEAEVFLRLLSGRRHAVMSCIVLVMPDGRLLSRFVQTKVLFKRLDESEIKDYLSSGEWEDKAGAYAIQGLAAVFVKSIIGSYSNVVGLCLPTTVSLLKGALGTVPFS